MEVFTQFSSDLDEATKKQLNYGQGLMRLLRQQQSNPFSLHQQVIILISATAKTMVDIPVEKILDFREYLLKSFETDEKGLCDRIDESGVFSDDDKEFIIEKAKEIRDRYKQEKNL